MSCVEDFMKLFFGEKAWQAFRKYPEYYRKFVFELLVGVLGISD